MCRLGLLATLGLAACISRPVDPVENNPQVTRTAKAWKPPEPNAKDWDWIRLNTGEWLKGDIKALRDRDFDFDSDKLNAQTFEWEDIHELRSPRTNTVVLVDRTTYTGTLLVKDGAVSMRTKDGERQFNRAELLSIIPGDIEFKLSYFVQVGVPDTSDTNQHFVMSLEIDLLKDIDLDITFQWDRVGQPRRAADGTLPEKDDFRTIIGFGWEF